MAIMAPDSRPSKATAGEQWAFALLRDGLPYNYNARYETVVAGRYPDFCLIADDFGLLVPEDEARHLRPSVRPDRPGSASRSPVRGVAARSPEGPIVRDRRTT